MTAEPDSVTAFRIQLGAGVAILDCLAKIMNDDSLHDGTEYYDAMEIEFRRVYKIVNGHPGTPEVIATKMYELKKYTLGDEM